MKIGTVIIEYTDDKKISFASFIPSMKVDIDISDLNKLEQESDENKLKNKADFILASWFSKMNEIELADRTEFEIISDIKTCDKYPSGNIKQCVIEYSFEKIMTKKS